MGHHKGIDHAHHGDEKLLCHQGQQHGSKLPVGKKMVCGGGGLVHGKVSFPAHSGNTPLYLGKYMYAQETPPCVS